MSLETLERLLILLMGVFYNSDWESPELDKSPDNPVHRVQKSLNVCEFLGLKFT